MKKKLLIVGISFVALVCLQIFSSGHEHVVVVEDNIQLTGENKKLTKANKTLTNNINQLKEENQQLESDKQNLETMVSKVIGDLDSTKLVVKQIKNELKDEKTVNSITNGREFEFQPISLPDSEGN